MIQDAWVVASQEWRTIRRSFLPSTGAMLTFGLILVLFGLVVPFGIAGGWLNAASYFFLWFWLVWLLIAGPISDSFAGERERHTLESLFATRLPDVAILLGKIAAVACFGCLLTWIALFAAASITFVFAGASAIAPSHPAYLAISAILTPVVALFASATGGAISLSVRSARQAHQIITAVVPVTAVGLFAIDWLLRSFIPALSASIDKSLSALAETPYACIGAATVIFLASVLAYAAAAHHLHCARVLPA